ncbi:MAG: hypothetical protein EBT59_07370 [Betaproteobacteria bacterium]|nr:hypothetical protein [Betaproteobacteria bacterium]
MDRRRRRRGHAGNYRQNHGYRSQSPRGSLSVRPIKSLLIANRGEIACRIIHSASSAGIKTIAIYSDADQAARHTCLADEAYRIGPAEPSESYLHIDAIIQLAKRLGVDAIHPGYGFLSENPRFAEACEEAAILFVGPSAASMQALGNKSAARRLAIELGIPVRPGYEGDAQDDDTFLASSFCLPLTAHSVCSK